MMNKKRLLFTLVIAILSVAIIVNDSLIIAFTSNDEMDVQNGRWVNNNSIVYATIDGTIHTVNAKNGAAQKVCYKPCSY